MLTSNQHLTDLFAALGPDTWLVSANRRQSAYLSTAFDQAQIASQQPAWAKPTVIAFSAFREFLEAKLVWDAPTLLLEGTLQEYLFEQVLRDSFRHEPLLRLQATTRWVVEAWNLARSYGLLDCYGQLTQPWPQQTAEQQRFLIWAQTYVKQCHDHGWCDEHQAFESVLQRLRAGAIKPPANVVWLGFSELEPKALALWTAWAKLGVSQSRASLIHEQGLSHHVRLEDPAEEYVTSARWARAQLLDRSDMRIGIIVPSLEQDRNRIERTFQDFFSPHDFNVSAPRPLCDYAFIQDTLLLLSLARVQIPRESVSHILSSPFIASAESEMSQRAELLAHLKFSDQLDLTELITRLKNWDAECAGPSKLTRLLENLASIPKPSRATTDEWLAYIADSLRALGWPGERGLDSNEHQLKHQWQVITQSYQAMAPVLQQHSYAEALHRLERLAEGISFLPQSNTEAPIQILGLLEGVGLPFDALWVCGLHREAWPPEPKPNPFIPANLQRLLNMPRASAARELYMAEKITAQLIRGGGQVIFSYSQDAGRVTQISKLISQWSQPLEVGELELAAFSKPLMTHRFEWFEDAHAPVLQATEKISGTRLLKLQAQCPFRAFAQIRLALAPPIAKTLGLTPAARGELVHLCIFTIWQKLKTQAHLRTIESRALSAICEEACRQVLTSWQVRHGKLEAVYQQLEIERLSQLLMAWLEFERIRPEFVIKAQELESHVHLAGLDFKGRIDRIDVIEGQEVIIDYKTGYCSISDWQGPMLKDPQMPLYALSQHPASQGIVYFELKTGSMNAKGLADNATLIPGLKSFKALSHYQFAANWSEQLQVWQIQIANLAEAFKNGQADVAPVKGALTCRHCHLTALCRRLEQLKPTST